MVQVTSMRAEQKEETSVQYIKGPENKNKITITNPLSGLEKKTGRM